MKNIPIALLFFTSTKGHFGFKKIYADTLEHLNKQIPLGNFTQKIGHIKVSPGEEELGEKMKSDLINYGFDDVILTVADWSRGVVHQNEYMRDVIRVSQKQNIYSCPYVLWLEDDSPFTSHPVSLETCLNRMTKMLDASPDILSVRFLRRPDLPSSPIIPSGNEEYFWSPHFNFQPVIMRSRDFYLACKIIDDNFESTKNIQCEMLWRLVLGPFSSEEKKHAVWYPDYGETFHIGIQDYENARKAIL